MKINSNIIFEQFIKIQQNAINSIKFSDIKVFNQSDLHSIASDIFQEIIENISD